MSSRVNLIARKERHQKLFEDYGKVVSLGKAASRVFSALNVFVLFGALFDLKRKRTVSDSLVSQVAVPDISHHVLDGSKILFKRVSILSAVLFVFGVVQIHPTEGSYDFYQSGSAEIDVSGYLGQNFIVNEEGYIVKAVPSDTNLSQYYDREGVIQHEIQPGEYLALIAQKYGLRVTTLMWANSITDRTILHPGDVLAVPNADGVLVKVKSGDTVEKYAQAYGIEASKIISVNSLEGDLLIAGNSIVVPDAKPLPAPEPKPRYAEVNRSESSTRVASAQQAPTGRVENVYTEPATGGVASMLFPTSGKVTQGYSYGHYALDIADASRPAVVAAAGGVIETVSVGTWGGGYGTHIIVNHGDGLKTLYAHLGKVYVSAGDPVSEGNAIGEMGNTGKVYGITGIHLHFEVWVGERKVNPWNWLR